MHIQTKYTSLFLRSLFLRFHPFFRSLFPQIFSRFLLLRSLTSLVPKIYLSSLLRPLPRYSPVLSQDSIFLKIPKILSSISIDTFSRYLHLSKIIYLFPRSLTSKFFYLNFIYTHPKIPLFPRLLYHSIPLYLHSIISIHSILSRFTKYIFISLFYFYYLN